VKITWTERAWEDYESWLGDERIAKIHALIKDIKRDPFKGIGQPEPLKGDLRGWWSRRITQEHRFVYQVTGKPYDLVIAQCRYHYGR
jgi:toxin YoeB